MIARRGSGRTWPFTARHRDEVRGRAGRAVGISDLELDRKARPGVRVVHVIIAALPGAVDVPVVRVRSGTTRDAGPPGACLVRVGGTRTVDRGGQGRGPR